MAVPYCKAGFYFRATDGVLPLIVGELSRFAKEFELLSRPQHAVTVYLIDRHSLRDGSCGVFKCFGEPGPELALPPLIVVCCRGWSVGETRHTLAHELLHYEQWRTTGDVWESTELYQIDELAEGLVEQILQLRGAIADVAG